MSVSGISSTTLSQLGSPSLAPSNRRQQEDQIGRELMQDLKNGDLKGAQQAYQQLAAFGPNNSGPFSDPTLKSEFQTLGQDLQSGHLAAAQSDAKTLASDQLSSDVQAVIKNAKASDSQDEKSAIANLKGDFWAVYGQQVTDAQLQQALGQGVGTTPINVQA